MSAWIFQKWRENLGYGKPKETRHPNWRDSSDTHELRVEYLRRVWDDPESYRWYNESTGEKLYWRDCQKPVLCDGIRCIAESPEHMTTCKGYRGIYAVTHRETCGYFTMSACGNYQMREEGKQREAE